MKTINCNQELRNTMFNKINADNKINIDENYAVVYYMNDFLNYVGGEHSKILEIEIYKNLALSIFFLDAYKIINYKIINKLELSPEEKVTFEKIKKISNFKELEQAMMSDDYLLKSCIKYSYDFKNSDVISKIIYNKSLTEADNEKLLKIATNHRYDMEAYNIPVTKQLLVKFINNLFVNEIAIPIIASNLLYSLTDLSKVDEDSFDEIFKSIITNEYKCNDFSINSIEKKEDGFFHEGYYIVKNANQTILDSNYEELKSKYLNDSSLFITSLISFLLVETEYGIFNYNLKKLLDYSKDKDYSNVIGSNHKGLNEL